MSETAHHNLVIIGGGSAGIAVAARLMKELENPDIAIIEPAKYHYYQPGWTMVGGGMITKEQTVKEMAEVMPIGLSWIRETATEIDPERHTVRIKDGRLIGYDFLVVAAGIQTDWKAVKGLPETLGQNNVCSIYDYDCAETTWKMLNSFTGGTALFTQPKPPFKCPGAAQKILYLADEIFDRNGARQSSRLLFRSAAPSIFPVKKYAETLNKVIERKHVEVKYQFHLTEVRGDVREAVFEHVTSGEQEIVKYDLLHVTPPMSAPDFIKKSPLSDAGGWVDVNKYTLQHARYPNIFGLGDVTNTPNSKTAAAIRAQLPVVVANLLATMRSAHSARQYDGYAACPLITGYGKLVLAEFNYDLEPQETFPFDQGQERLTMYWFKRYFLPQFYWHGLLKGQTLEMIG